MQHILSLATVQGADTRHFCSRSAVGLAEWAALTQGVQDRAGWSQQPLSSYNPTTQKGWQVLSGQLVSPAQHS